MKATKFEVLSNNDLTDVNGGAIGIIGSFLMVSIKYTSGHTTTYAESNYCSPDYKSTINFIEFTF